MATDIERALAVAKQKNEDIDRSMSVDQYMSRPAYRRPDTLTARQNTPLDYATDAVTGVMNKVLPTNRSGRQFRDDRTREFLDYFTPVGAAEGLYQAGQSLGAGNYGSALFELPLAVASVIPGAAFGSRGVRAGEKAVQQATQVARDTQSLGQAIPPPVRTLALPAPVPLPPHAVKPRGGQWWANSYFDTPDNPAWSNTSPEAAAQHAADNWPGAYEDRLAYALAPEPRGPETRRPEQQWLEKALTKYYKTDFGAPDDPLRTLAERGLHYDSNMTPDAWRTMADDRIDRDAIGDVLFPINIKGGMPGAGSDMRADALRTMPWLAQLPVTDNIYGIPHGGLDLRHFMDEFSNALNPERSGLPADLALRLESLQRMSFPQAVEHVGKINQYRAKEMTRAALEAQKNPAVHTFKEYAENNPMGLRWTELKTPELTDDLLTDNDRRLIEIAKEQGTPHHLDVINMAKSGRAEGFLQDALKNEGDIMGHCVGGYCDEVSSGRSRIFSLRDAKGEPHVTIETEPRNADTELARAAENDPYMGEAWNEFYYGKDGGSDLDQFLKEKYPDMFAKYGHLLDENLPDDIVQIKGKQNRAPKDDYLPFVQDFVKSQKWGNVGDLRNTQLVKLPDGRYITSQQAEEGIGKMSGTRIYSNEALQNLTPEEWAVEAPQFEGYAIGGRIPAHRCFAATSR
jgi:hypothetical protein